MVWILEVSESHSSFLYLMQQKRIWPSSCGVWRIQRRMWGKQHCRYLELNILSNSHDLDWSHFLWVGGGGVKYMHFSRLTCVLFLHRPCWVSWNMMWSPWVGRIFRLCQSAAETHLCLWKRRPCSVWGTCSVWVEPHSDGMVTEVTVGKI